MPNGSNAASPPATAPLRSRPTCPKCSSRTRASLTRKRNMMKPRCSPYAPSSANPTAKAHGTFSAAPTSPPAITKTPRRSPSAPSKPMATITILLFPTSSLEQLGRKKETEQLRDRMIKVLRQQLELVPEDVRARILLSTNLAHFGPAKRTKAFGICRPLSRFVPAIQYALQCRVHLRHPGKEGGGARNFQEGSGGRVRQSELGGQGFRSCLPARRSRISEAS